MSRFDALWPLHRALVLAMAGSADVLTWLGVDPQGGPAIYSGTAPTEAGFPRLTIGLSVGTAFDTLDDAGATVAVEIHAWGGAYDIVIPLLAAALAAAEAVTALPTPPGGWPNGIPLAAFNATTSIVSILSDPEPNVAHGVGRWTGTLNRAA